jgi:methylenetetrahydrofolate dehydrogenase (NADP+)/methenyltetrahydrofolate cyclohydrolase
MIVDGKAIAQRVYEETASLVSGLSRRPVLAAVTCAPNFETKKYLNLKKKKAAQVGIVLRIVELPDTITTSEVIASIKGLLPEVDGVVVQLPFPPHIDREQVLVSVPKEKDPDGFSFGVEEGSQLPPVVGAIQVIAETYNISFVKKNVVVLGQGRLVGAPAARFMRAAGANVTTLTESDGAPTSFLKEADIIISGIGVPHLITPDMLKEGVVIFDAGTSEDGGVVAGDVHPEVAHKASVFTPVPGGIGPITVAILLKNLITLIRQEK